MGSVNIVKKRRASSYVVAVSSDEVGTCGLNERRPVKFRRALFNGHSDGTMGQMKFSVAGNRYICPIPLTYRGAMCIKDKS